MREKEVCQVTLFRILLVRVSDGFPGDAVHTPS